MKFILPVIILLIFLSGFFLWQRSQAKPGLLNLPSLTPLSIAMDWTPNTNHTGIYVALAKGWYKDQDLYVKILPYSSSVTPDVLVYSGKADIGVSSTENIVSDAASGQPVVSIASIIEHNSSGFITLADSHINSPKDLDGKNYGGFGAPYENAVVSEIIKKAGGQGKFNNITLSIDAMQALESKRVDFVWVFKGWELIQAERKGLKVNFFPITDYGIADYYTPTLITSQKNIKEKQIILKKFMSATAQGYEFARAHPKEAAQILLDQAPKGTFPDTGLVLASQEFVSRHYADPGQKWGIQAKNAWLLYPQFLLSSGGITDNSGKPVRSLDFTALYTNIFLP